LKESWKSVVGYEGLYEVSSFGCVKSLKRKYAGERMLKQRKASSGYLYVDLYKNGTRKSFRVHKLVANSFVENPLSLPQINHIDGNKQNNNVRNLEWCTARGNIVHAVKHGLKRSTRNHAAISKTVKMYTSDGAYINTYPSTREAERQTGILQQSISKCCLGKRRTAGGYTWRYADESSREAI
jgi:hypothetical protein